MSVAWKISAGLVMVVATLAVVEFSPERTIEDDAYHFLVDDDATLETVAEIGPRRMIDEWQDGDRILSVIVEDGVVDTVGVFTVRRDGRNRSVGDHEWSRDVDQIAGILGWK